MLLLVVMVRYHDSYHGIYIKLELGEIPQVLAATRGVGNPVLDFVNDVCHVLSLNKDVESEVATLKRVNCITTFTKKSNFTLAEPSEAD